MKTRIIKERIPGKSTSSYSRKKAIRVKLLRRMAKRGAAASQKSDRSAEQHQAKSSDENGEVLSHDSLEFMKYRIFEAIKDIKL